ncbi:PspC domain-containing protein [Chloroflexales bacterium ZM16-3]|nr:PspC domain-containing protein [Chloroflexales bacterium ZM16-3]
MQTPLRLMRSRDDKMIAGVAGGIGRYLNIDPVLVRLAFVLLALSGATLLIYPLLWIIMPEEPVGSPPTQPGGQVFVAEGTPTQRIRIDPSTGAPQQPQQEIPIQNIGAGQPSGADPMSRQRLLGAVLLGVGAFIAIRLLIPGIGSLLIPALLIAGGVWLLRRG